MARASRMRLLMVSLTLGVAGAGCAGLERSGSSRTAGPVAPVRVEQAGVSVEVQVIDAEQARDIFDADLLERGIQPLVVRIRNESTTTYRFEKANVDAPYIPAATAAKQAYENPVLVTGQVLSRVVFGSIGRIAVKSGGTTPRRPILNREIRESFVKEEIADTDIGPHGSLEGFLYVRPLEPDGRLSVTLIDTQTKEPLRFELRTSPSASAPRSVGSLRSPLPRRGSGSLGENPEARGRGAGKPGAPNFTPHGGRSFDSAQDRGERAERVEPRHPALPDKSEAPPAGRIARGVG